MRSTLICTVGTSLFGNLKRLDPHGAHRALLEEHRRSDWTRVASLLAGIDPADRLCGAEINSVNDLVSKALVARGRLHLLASDTPEGNDVGAVLNGYFRAGGWRASVHAIDGLKDDDPGAFRTRGLRNLAKAIGERVREYGAEQCAINATGGYKAQIAITVLMGQALGIPVYYKHERFNAIIPFPPMPVALDSSLWERASGMFVALGETNEMAPWEDFADDWDERFEPLVNRETVDGEEYLELSATGQIFHETFRTRFRRSRKGRLPREATRSEKRSPVLTDHAWKRAREPITRHLGRVTDEVSYVTGCHATYWNPDLPATPRFRLSGGEVEGVYSNGSWCVRFRVLTTAGEGDDLGVVVADLNEWLAGRGGAGRPR